MIKVLPIKTADGDNDKDKSNIDDKITAKNITKYNHNDNHKSYSR